MSGPTSVRALVHAARRRWLAARWVESALLGGAVAGVALAAAIVSGAPPGSPGALLAAALCGALAAWTLASERRRTPLAFAQRLDQRLDEGGALATAFECEGSREAGTVADLHVARTLGRLDRRRLVSAVAPPSAAFLAALALGAALAALAAERGHGPEAAQVRAGVALGRLAALAEEPAAIATGALDEALQVAGALDDVQAAAPQARAEAVQALETLLAPGALDAQTERRARSLLERLSASLEARPGAPAAGSREPALAGEPAGRTMAGLPEEPPVPTTPPTTPPAVAAAPAGRWWPPRHDAVVAGYVERTRAHLAAPAPGAQGPGEPQRERR